MTVDLNTTNPLSFIEWKQYYNNILEASELSNLYNSYLVEWKDNKLTTNTKKDSFVKELYVQFLNSISTDTLDPSTKRFLSQIDTDNNYELELAVHYFTDITKQQLVNIRELRDESKFSNVKNKLKTSKKGIELYIKNYISKLLSIKEFITKETNTKVSDINISKIANSIKINFDNYASDEHLYDIHNLNKNVVTDLGKRVREEAPNIIQLLTINKDGKKLKIQTNNISTPNSLLGMNEYFEDYKRLPSRYFRNEIKELANLKYTIEKNLIEKYIANDLYLITGNREKANIEKIFTRTNPTNNLTQRYGPNLYRDIINRKNTNIYPYQLSYKNTGSTNFYSKGVTFNIQLSSVNSCEYIVPDPNLYESGLKPIGYIKNPETKETIGNLKIKQITPLVFSNKNDRLKNNDLTNNVEFYDNKILRTYGYQSQENSLNYSIAGINKREDTISFWEDKPNQINWKNTDTYPVSVLNIYPEAERLEDLLINNKTGIKLRSDIYGNEFYFIKAAHPKRYAGTSYIPSPGSSSTTECITSAEYYDGLFFSGALCAISAAEYETYGTVWDVTYDSATTQLTGIYDTFIVSDGTTCAGDTEQFNAPMSTASCNDIHTIGLSCGSVSAVSAIECGTFLNHPGNSTDLLEVYFTDTSVPYISVNTSSIFTGTTTTYEASGTNNPTVSSIPLYEHTYETNGEVYVRNVYTQKIQTLNEAMSGILNKHSGSTRLRVLTSSYIQDFDIIEDTLYIQTSAETLTERYKFKDGIFKNNASSKSIIL